MQLFKKMEKLYLALSLLKINFQGSLAKFMLYMVHFKGSLCARIDQKMGRGVCAEDNRTEDLCCVYDKDWLSRCQI